ncbi:MAG: HAD hydrolase-like protein [Firmicutes bacterium]|nr:HAD hydrolase-like protein [Bacillota bacterium]
MYQFLFFDFDGTISDTGPGIMRSAAYALARYGLHPAEAELRAFIGPAPNHRFREYYGMDEARTAEATGLFRAMYEARGKFEHSLYPGMAELLRELSAAGRSLAVASAKPLPLVREILSGDGIMGCFTAVCGSDPEGRPVEKGAILGAAMEALGVTDPGSAVMIGDRSLDVLGAQAQGLACVGVSYGYAEPGELEAAGAIKICASVAELREFLMGA